MHTYKSVPVERARSLAVEFNKSIVVILCWDDVHNLMHTTTYGVSALDKVHAAAAGDVATKALGGDLGAKLVNEDFRLDLDAALFREAVELLDKIRTRNGCTPEMVQQAERIAGAAGFPARQG